MILLGVSLEEDSRIFKDVVQTIIRNNQKEKNTLPDKVRGCKHPLPIQKAYKFCPECGKAAYLANPDKEIIDRKYIDSFGLESFLEDMLRESTLMYEYNGRIGEFVIGTDVKDISVQSTFAEAKEAIAETFNQIFDSQLKPTSINFYGDF